MKNKFLILLALFGALFAAAQPKDWANFKRYDSLNQYVQPGTIVMMGNSITQGWADKQPDFFKQHNLTGRGIGGQTTSEMLVRFRKDVIGLKPKAVVILAGINDIAQNNGPIALDNILGNIISMCELAKMHQIKVYLCSVLPAYEFPWRKNMQYVADTVMALNTMIKAYAQKNKIAYIDYHTAMKDSRNGLPSELAYDEVHPTEEGYNQMQKIFLAVIKKKR